ncbi:MAG: metallophosphoesterase family protein [Thermoleophilia bacterium]
MTRLRGDLDRPCRIGVVSDTHGRMDEDALARLEGVDAILHAGDIGRPTVLDLLATVAPVMAVRGNVDVQPWAFDLPWVRLEEVCGHRVLLGHIRESLVGGRKPAEEGIDIVVFGHSHRPLEERVGGVLYLNPGSVGPRRFGLPRSLALLTLSEGGAESEIVIL